MASEEVMDEIWNEDPYDEVAPEDEEEGDDQMDCEDE